VRDGATASRQSTNAYNYAMSDIPQRLKKERVCPKPTVRYAYPIDPLTGKKILSGRYPITGPTTKALSHSRMLAAAERAIEAADSEARKALEL
jgi:hypothetical protein